MPPEPTRRLAAVWSAEISAPDRGARGAERPADPPAPEPDRGADSPRTPPAHGTAHDTPHDDADDPTRDPPHPDTPGVGSPAHDPTNRPLPRELLRLARAQSEQHGGRLVKRSNHALLGVHDSTDAGVRAAVGLRDAFLSSPEARGVDATIRIGLHLGDVVEGSDGDVYGDAVQAASRIESLAEPGQVVVSDIAYRLLRDRTLLDVEDLGERDLKGLGEVRLYAVSIPGDAEPADLRELLKDELAPLQILDVAAFGGMGEIYLARDPRLRRTLAVKVLRSELVADREARARFLREAQVVAGLAHPNVVTIHSVGELRDGTPYFVMDYVEAGSLADHLEREGPLTLRETRRIVGEVASALAAAHTRGVVHRDIKASNVLAADGRALVTDWGIAALDPKTELSPETRLTRAGSVIGSPRYMSPEQLAGDDVGPETDVYSLGLLAYELLTGRGPFEAETPRALMVAHLREEPPRLSELVPQVDPELESVILRCLAKGPAERITAEELASRFAPGAGEVLEWPPPGLESLKGALFKFQIGVGAFGLAVASPVILSFLARWEWAGQEAIRDLLQGQLGSFVVLSALFGMMALVVGVLLATERQHIVVEQSRSLKRSFREVAEGQRAFTLGYGWRTLIEVAGDRWGDFGRLLAGQREYAVLDAGQRDRVRRRVLWRNLLITGVTLAFPFLGLSIAWAAQSMPDWLAVVLFGGLPLALWLGAIALPTDPGPVKRARLALARRPESDEVLQSEVEAWHEALREVTGERPRSVRRTTRRGYWLLQLAQLTLGLAGYIYLLGALTALVMGDISSASLSGTDRSGQFAWVGQSSAFRVPADPSVTPLAARTLVESIAGGAATAATWVGPEPDPGSLVGSPLVGQSARPYALVPAAVIPTALRGPSPAEVEYLRRFAGDPRTPEFLRLARASGYDPAPADAYPADLHFLEAGARPGRGLVEAAMSRVAVAGHLLANGDTSGAEVALEEVYSVGHLLARESNELTFASAGRTVATLALDGLRPLYAASGRFDDGVVRIPEPAAMPAELSWRDWLERTNATIADTTTVRSVRLASMYELRGAFECGSVEGVILGLPPEMAERIDRAARSLHRYPSDEAYIDMVVTSQRRLHDRLRSASTADLSELTGQNAIPLWLMRFASRVTGNRRFLTCPGFFAVR